MDRLAVRRLLQVADKRLSALFTVLAGAVGMASGVGEWVGMGALLGLAIALVYVHTLRTARQRRRRNIQ